jgi:hypothetical protein
MNKNVALILLIVLSGLGCKPTSTYRQLYTLNGDTVNLEENNYVVMFLVPDCPLALNYTMEFQSLADSFSSPNLVFKAVVAGNQYSKKEIEDYLLKSGFRMPVLIDKHFEWCRKLDVKVSPTFYLLNKEGQILYFGALNNRVKELGQTKMITTAHYLRDAIISWNGKEPIKTTSSKPKGCFLEYN